MLYSNSTQQIKRLCDFFLILAAGYRPVPREYPNFCLRSDESNEMSLLQCFFSQNGKHNEDKKCVKVACDCALQQTSLLTVFTSY
jgi:hypothetical protein